MSPEQFVKLVAAMKYDGEELSDGTFYDQPHNELYDSHLFVIEQAREIVKECGL